MDGPRGPTAGGVDAGHKESDASLAALDRVGS
jgi:hypothetical protein